MDVKWRYTILIAVSVLTWAGCPSDCSRLCTRQIECLGDPGQLASADGTRLSADGQREVCRTVCETLQRDPERREGLKGLLACIDSPCSEFGDCIKQISGAK